jgi:hypothetical protein
MNSKIVKSGIIVLTEREKDDVADADMVVGCCWSAGSRE